MSDQFCQAVCAIFVSIRLTDITLNKIGWRDRKIPISKLVGEPGKIRQTAWQNQSDVTKIGIDKNWKEHCTCKQGLKTGARGHFHKTLFPS
jgi:hypothetical protein